MFILSQTRQEVYAWCNIQACTHNCCCCGKVVKNLNSVALVRMRTIPVSITYSQCVFISLVIQHVKCICCIILLSVVCLVVQDGLSSSAILFYIISKRHNFWKKIYWTCKGCFDFLYRCLLKHFLFF